MRKDRTKALLSLIATLTSALLLLIYWLVPADANSHRLHILLIECIPDVLVVLIAIPVVYWLFYRRGLTNMGDCPLFTVESRHSDRCHHRNERFVPWISKKTSKAASRGSEVGTRDVLVVVDAVAGSLGAWQVENLAEPLNSAIRAAMARAMSVAFVRPKGESSQDAWCLTGRGKDAVSAVVDRPPGSAVFDLATKAKSSGGFAEQNSAWDLLISSPAVRTVYVAGVTLEPSVEAICRNVLRRGKRVIALETAIATADDDAERIEEVWRRLVAEGVVRIPYLPVLDEHSAAG